MYDPRDKKLKQLSPVDPAKADSYDMSYLGAHSVVESVLEDFVKGQIVRGDLSTRADYRGQKVLDMSKIRMDFARNEVTDRSFVLLDHDFFKDKETSNAQP